jgi:succinoglycan biosynthesis protein ExoA
LANTVERKPELSVILPVRNEATHLARLVGEMRRQTLAPALYEIIVVDGMSSDGSREILAALAADDPVLRVVDNPGYLASRARNLGVEAARGRYVLFVDGHCRLESPRLFEATLDAFRKGALCVSRPQHLLREGVGRFSRAAAVARTSWIGHYMGSQIYRDRPVLCDPTSAGCGYERAFYRSLGGVDESYDACEDLDLNHRVRRAGVQAVHSPEFAVSYYPRRNWRSLLRQLYRYGFGRGRMLRKFPRTFSVLTSGLSLFTLLMLALPLAGLVWPPAWTLWLLQLGVYAAIVVAMSTWLAAREGWDLWWDLVHSFVCIHLGAGMGFFAGLWGGPSGSHAPRGFGPQDARAWRRRALSLEAHSATSLQDLHK